MHDVLMGSMHFFVTLSHFLCAYISFILSVHTVYVHLSHCSSIMFSYTRHSGTSTFTA